MEKKYQWLLEIADKKPLLFSVALLLITVGVLAGVVKERNKALEECYQYTKVVDGYWKAKLDSASAHHYKREMELETEVKRTLNTIIEEYRTRLEEQQRLNEQITFTINENQKIIKTKRR